MGGRETAIPGPSPSQMRRAKAKARIAIWRFVRRVREAIGADPATRRALQARKPRAQSPSPADEPQAR